MHIIKYRINVEKYIYLMSFVQLTAATDRINALREEQEQLQKENTNILQSSQRKEEVRVAIEMLCYENNQYEYASVHWKSR